MGQPIFVVIYRCHKTTIPKVSAVLIDFIVLFYLGSYGYLCVCGSKLYIVLLFLFHTTSKKEEANKQSKTTVTYGVSHSIICFKKLCESYLQFIRLNKTQIFLFRPVLPFHVFPFSSYAECQTIRSCRCCKVRKTLNVKFPVSGRRLHMKETFKPFRV